jgi:hypothetical protein
MFEFEHTFFCDLTPTELAIALPIVKPLIVRVNATAGMAAPVVVIVTEVDEEEPHDAVNPVTLLAPETTEGTK